MNYWIEAVEAACDELEINIEQDKLKEFAEAMKISAELESEYNGNCYIHIKSDTEKELEELKKQIDSRENWLNSTKPCHVCHTSGIIKDGWGRTVDCYNCDGKGRINNK